MFTCEVLGRKVVAPKQRFQVRVLLEGGPAGRTAEVSLRWPDGARGPKATRLSSSGKGDAVFFVTLAMTGRVSITARATAEGRDATPDTLTVRVT